MIQSNNLETNNPEIAFIGYITVDKNIYLNSNVEVLPGGGAFFGAIAASRLLNNVGLVSRVGFEYVRPKLLDRVRNEGIKIDSRGKTAESTLRYLSNEDHTDREVSVEWGVASKLRGEDISEEWLSFLKIIHLSTMMPLQQHSILEYIRKHAPQLKISIDTDSFLLADPENSEIIQESYSRSDIGFVNRKEYKTLRLVVDKMPEAVVKLDKDGAFYMEKGVVKAIAKIKHVEVVDVTGAGDIFAGTFLSCSLLHFSSKEALIESTKIATDSVRENGLKNLFSK